MTGAVRYAPYSPRPVSTLGRIEHRGHRLKLYAIHHDNAMSDPEEFESGLELALEDLPAAAPSEGCPGLGFVILHRGTKMDYVVLAWWTNENELPVRVHVRMRGGTWRVAEAESFCVWDLEVIAHERDAYVETVLAPEPVGPERAYLDRRFGEQRKG